jgi:hypothetical protein
VTVDRHITRTYVFSEREIAEALIAALKAKDIPAPPVANNTPTCRWEKQDGGLAVTWTSEDGFNIEPSRKT